MPYITSSSATSFNVPAVVEPSINLPVILAHIVRRYTGTFKEKCTRNIRTIVVNRMREIWQDLLPYHESEPLRKFLCSFHPAHNKVHTTSTSLEI